MRSSDVVKRGKVGPWWPYLAVIEAEGDDADEHFDGEDDSEHDVGDLIVTVQDRAKSQEQ